MRDDQKPANGLRGQDKGQGDLRDVQGGTFDRDDRAGGRQGVRENRTPRAGAQAGAVVRGNPVPPEKDPIPADLAHREGPMNKSTGRHTVNPKQ
jgi:hypothetical protein